jgi:hypothetical protein
MSTLNIPHHIPQHPARGGHPSMIGGFDPLPTPEAWGRFLASWWAHFGDEWVVVDDLVALGVVGASLAGRLEHVGFRARRSALGRALYAARGKRVASWYVHWREGSQSTPQRFRLEPADTERST